MEAGHGEEVQREVVERYLAGHRIDEIVRDTGVSKPTIYAYVRRAGYSPARKTRTAPLHARDLMEQLSEAHREIGRLEQQLSAALAEIERLKKRRR